MTMEVLYITDGLIDGFNSILVTGIAVLCLPIASSFTWFAIIVGFYGFGLGCWFLLIPVLLSEYHGTEAIASSYGLVRLFQGFITLVVPPFIGNPVPLLYYSLNVKKKYITLSRTGFTKDAVGDYQLGFYVMGSCMVIGSILIHFEPCAKRLADRKKDIMNFHKKTAA